MDDAKELIEQAKAEIAMFERPARATSLSMVEIIQEQAAKIAELEKGYEQLRIAALNAVCKIGGGQAKADLRGAYDKATEQLEALKEQDNG
jgi:hypothetical protein